jgi:hypothetical protein
MFVVELFICCVLAFLFPIQPSGSRYKHSAQLRLMLLRQDILTLPYGVRSPESKDSEILLFFLIVRRSFHALQSLVAFDSSMDAHY